MEVIFGLHHVACWICVYYTSPYDTTLDFHCFDVLHICVVEESK